MQEQHKTLTFVLVAAIAALVAWEPWRPSLSTSNVPEGVGEKLFPEFKDPLAAKSLEVVTFNEEDATLRDFKVAQQNGVWSIPSHNDYPADAADHMAQAATALLDLEKLNLASDKPGDQELYGVITPDVSKLRPGMVGVGTRIIVKGDQEKPLADLVIGKDVKDQPGLRYVRSADRDQIYIVKVKTDKFSTKFEDWIEKDLLKLQAFDVRDVELNDYSTADNVTVDGGIQLQVKKRNRIKLAYDDTKSNWKLVEISEFDEKGNPIPSELAEDEELNNEKLNALKTALDDLKIVDVQRKPKGLSQDLKASDELVKDNEAALSLVQRGFFPVGADREIYSSEGEATCTTKDGVRYVLRFGRLAGGDEGGSDGKGEGDGKEKSNPALNRYLFVMAQFDDSQIAKPQLEPAEGEDKPDEGKSEETDKPADAKQADEAKKADEKPEDASETKTAAQDDAEKKSDEKAAPAPDAPAAEEKKPSTPDEEKKIAIERENKRKQDDYDNAIKKGQEKVKELNERFADWYFIIPDDVYKKIHLGRAEIVKKKEAKDAKDAAAAPGDLPAIDGKPEVE